MNRRFQKIIPIILLFTWALASCGSHNNLSLDIAADDFLRNREGSNSFVLDVRTKAEYERGHLADARLIDLYSPGAGDALMKLDKSATYYVYCHSGVRSRSIVQIMHENGFSNVFNIRGGVIDLARSGATFEK